MKTKEKVLLSFHGDENLKKDLIEEMEAHQKADDLIQGTYNQSNGRFKGCAVGCSIESLNRRRGLKLNYYNDHAGLGEAIGAPEWLIRLQDSFFENLPKKYAKQFPVDFYQAIPVGADLEPVKWRFCAFILQENITLVLALKIDDKLKEQVITAIRKVLSVHEKAIAAGEWDESAAESAESAAWSAARSAAWSAARSARSAAWSAADSAARSADSAERFVAYKRYADKLLDLLRESR